MAEEIKSFVQLLNKYFKKAGLTQPQLARSVGAKDARSVYAWLGGLYVPEEKHLYGLIRTFYKRGVITNEDDAKEFWELANEEKPKGYNEKFDTTQLPVLQDPAPILLPQLRWKGLKRHNQTLNETHSEEISKKFREEKPLYLQRQAVLELFEDFLATDKSACLLLGQSGSGKTLFSLSLVDRFQTNPNCAILFYNAAHLNTGQTLAEHIYKDLGLDYFSPGQSSQPAQPFSLFSRPDLSKVMEAHQLIVIFDGLNEKEAPRDLLLQVKNLLDEGYRYPWFKMLLCSRPEAWQNLRREIGIPEKYFYRPKASTLNTTGTAFSRRVRPDSFEPNIEMPLFSPFEVAQVYSNY